jgi:hypothetical protein
VLFPYQSADRKLVGLVLRLGALRSHPVLPDRRPL